MAKWFINPGHGKRNDGGLDPGAIGPTGLKEYDVANLFSWILKYYLTQQGETVLDPYQDGDLADIVAKADKSGADFFISCHLNSSTDPSAHGYEVYSLATTGQGHTLAAYIDEALGGSGLTNRGIKQANFYVMVYTNMPAVLLELCFISNSQEEALAKNRSFLEQRAIEVTKACLRMVGKTWVEPQPPAPPAAPPVAQVVVPPAPVVDAEKEQLKVQLADANAKLDAIRKVVM